MAVACELHARGALGQVRVGHGQGRQDGAAPVRPGLLCQLLAALLGIPALRDLMGLAPAGLAAWGAGAGVLVLSVVWLEGLRRIARRKENAR